jgi:hypothetical protein
MIDTYLHLSWSSRKRTCTEKLLAFVVFGESLFEGSNIIEPILYPCSIYEGVHKTHKDNMMNTLIFLSFKSEVNLICVLVSNVSTRILRWRHVWHLKWF